MYKSLTAIAVLAAAASPAFAEGFYADAGYQFINIDEDGVEADLGAVTGHVGYNFNEWFALEGEAGFGVKDETVTFAGVDIDTSLNYVVGAYARAQMPVGQRATLFARAGVVNAEIELSAAGFSDSGSDTGAGLGAGGEVMLSDTMALRGEYTRYDIEDLEADTFTVALGFKF